MSLCNSNTFVCVFTYTYMMTIFNKYIKVIKRNTPGNLKQIFFLKKLYIHHHLFLRASGTLARLTST